MQMAQQTYIFPVTFASRSQVFLLKRDQYAKSEHSLESVVRRGSTDNLQSIRYASTERKHALIEIM